MSSLYSTGETKIQDSYISYEGQSDQIILSQIKGPDHKSKYVYGTLKHCVNK